MTLKPSQSTARIFYGTNFRSEALIEGILYDESDNLFDTLASRVLGQNVFLVHEESDILQLPKPNDLVNSIIQLEYNNRAFEDSAVLIGHVLSCIYFFTLKLNKGKNYTPTSYKLSKEGDEFQIVKTFSSVTDRKNSPRKKKRAQNDKFKKRVSSLRRKQNYF